MAADDLTASAPPPGDRAARPDAASQGGGVEVRTEAGRTSVRFWGAVDLAVRVSAGEDLRAVADPSTALEVDCRDVVFMDSTGLSVLVRVIRDGTTGGRPVRFLGAGPQVRDLLEVTGVDEWMASLGVEGARPSA